jgi:uncharacterized radical SAM superfamily protein
MSVASEPTIERTEGMRARLNRFGTSIVFYAPGLKRWRSSEWVPERADSFVPVSLTGTGCALHCAHCDTRMLAGMATLGRRRDLFATAQRLHASGAEGLLVTGGANRSGGVPLAPHLDAIARIREQLGMRVAVHTGVTTTQVAEGLAQAGADAVMVDVIGARETLREVYHLDLTPTDVERSLALLTGRGLPVIPHIVLGLHWGRLLGEWDALEIVARHPATALVLVILTPLPGTPMQQVAPPSLEAVTEFFAYARARLPETPILLGCARPAGVIKQAIDRAAIDHGFNGIAFPADGAIAYARAAGLEPVFHEQCCAIGWESV